MRRLLLSISAAGLLAVGSPRPALAWTFTNVCGGSTFQTCASGWLTAATVSGKTVVTISVTNLGNYNTVFKAVGLINMPAGAVANFTGGTAKEAGWQGEPPKELSGGGLPEGTYAAVKKVNAPNTGLMVNSTLTYQFTFTTLLSAPQIAALGVGIHGISGPNGCSTKLGITSAGEPVKAGPYDPECVPTTTVPEPLTMALLGTGLAGIAGVARRRRRNDELIEDEV